MAGFSINQFELEEANFITLIFDGRYQRNDVANYAAVQARQTNELKLFQKPAIGWKIECESNSASSNYLTRQEAYEMIFEKKLNT